jgi:hypothetical protein
MLTLRVERETAIDELRAVSPGSEIRLPPNANVWSFLDAHVASCMHASECGSQFDAVNQVRRGN